MTGILVENLSASQFNFSLIDYLNKSSDEIGVFYKEVVRPCSEPHFFTAPLAEAIHCPETIATNLELAHFSLRLGVKRRSLFMLDLEWLRNKDYQYTSKIYNDLEFTILARSDSHKKAFESAWNRQAYLFNFEDL